MNGEWKAALRLQLEALAKRNDLHRRCGRQSVRCRTQEMDDRIVKLRELLSTDANQAAQFYLECVCHADETERILNRTSSRDKRKRKNKEMSQTSSAPTIASIPSMAAMDLMLPLAIPYPERSPQDQANRWWDQLQLHRRDEYYTEGKHESRQAWKSQSESLFSSLGFIVGAGSLIRFPGLAFEYGGGSFVLAYLLLNLLLGFPLVLLQLLLGQFSGEQPPQAISKLMPIATGLGCSLVASIVPLLIYYNMYTGWSLYYLFTLIKGGLTNSSPWEDCSLVVNTSDICCNLRSSSNCMNATATAQESYFHLSFLPESDFSPSLHLMLPLCLAWLLVLLFRLRAIRNTSFLVTVSATLPYLMLTLLFLRAISLPGADRGISFLSSVDPEQISSPKVWQVAAEQVLFELGQNSAALLSVASLNRFRNNIYRDSVILVSSSVCCSILSALAAFSLMGVMSAGSGMDFSKLIVREPRYLVFPVYSSLSGLATGGQHLSIAFFSILTLSLIQTQSIWLSTITSTLLAMFQSKNGDLERKMTFGLCLLCLLLGIPLCSKYGILLFHSLDVLSVNWMTMSVLLLLLLIVGQCYGTSRLLADLSSMLRLSPSVSPSAPSPPPGDTAFYGPTGLLVHYSWSTVCPIILLVLIVASLAGFERVTFSSTTVPWPIEMVAWLIFTIPNLIIPISIVRAVVLTRKHGKTLKSLFDSANWSPGELTDYGSNEGADPSSSSAPPPDRRRTAVRENTYMYIDPMSRRQTTHSALFSVEENYGWRVGRLKEVQDEPSLNDSSSQPSFAASMTSHGELTLFGSPPASNAFMLEEIRAARPAKKNTTVDMEKKRDSLSNENILLRPPAVNHQSRSEPPIKAPPSPQSRVPSPPAPRCSPARSEPPLGMDRPSSSVRSKSESHDDFSEDSDEENGIRPQRVTVIRRFRSSDSFGPASTGSISITPIDLDRQRSLSSVAIYDQQQRESRPTQSLSQLKRPAPIHAPHSPTRF